MENTQLYKTIKFILKNSLGNLGRTCYWRRQKWQVEVLNIHITRTDSPGEKILLA